jgi:hypothetical protein
MKEGGVVAGHSVCRRVSAGKKREQQRVADLIDLEIFMAVG